MRSGVKRIGTGSQLAGLSRLTRRLALLRRRDEKEAIVEELDALKLQLDEARACAAPRVGSSAHSHVSAPARTWPALTRAPGSRQRPADLRAHAA